MLQVATVCFVQFQWLSILHCRKLRRYLYNIISFGYQIVFICCFACGVSRKIVSIKIAVLVLFMPIAGVLKPLQRVGCAGVWWIINEIERAVWTGSCFVPPMRTKGEHYYLRYYRTILLSCTCTRGCASALRIGYGSCNHVLKHKHNGASDMLSLGAIGALPCFSMA